MPYRIDITDRLQRRMLEIVGTALRMIPRSAVDADFPGLAHLRGEMVHAIECYCRHVHFLREEAIRLERPNDARRAALLIKSCAHLQQAYDDFRIRWAHRVVADNWHEYRLSAIVMMKHVRAHVLDTTHAEDVTKRLAA